MEPEQNQEDQEHNIKFPYNGYSKHLIDKFLIFGYDSSLIDSEFKKELENNRRDNDFIDKYIQSFTENFILINSISSIDKKKIDNDTILKYTFPHKPLIIVTDYKRGLDFGNYSVTFQIKNSSENQTTIYHCFSYVCYKETKNRDFNVFYPYCFTIISNYPMFSFFKNLCDKLLKQFTVKNNIAIPLEIQMYNIVNYLPTPIGGTIDYDLFLSKNLSYYESDENNDPNASRMSVYSTVSRVVVSDTLTNKQIDSPYLTLNHISGYPYPDIRVMEIFKIFQPEQILHLILFTFLEFDMIYYCSDIEVLNSFMIVMNSLTYPSDDNGMSFFIASSAEKRFYKDRRLFNENNKIKGVVASTIPFESLQKLGDYKKIILVSLEENNIIAEYDQIGTNLTEIMNYLKKLMKKVNNKVYLDRVINEFFKKLKFFHKSVNPSGKNLLDRKNNLKTRINFFAKKEHNNYERDFLNACYDFILDLISLIYKIEDAFTNKKTSKMDEFQREEISLANFIKLTKRHRKFRQFKADFKTSDTYQISSLFLEEFLNLKKTRNEKLSLPYYDIISDFYKKDVDKLKLNFDEFYSQYTSDLMKNIYDFTDRSDIIPKTEQKITFNYDGYELNQQLINYYQYLLNDLPNEKQIYDYFPDAEPAELEEFELSEIANLIGTEMVEKKILSSIETIFYCYFSLFLATTSVKNIQSQFLIFDTLLKSLCKNRAVLERKYLVNSLFIYSTICKSKMSRNEDYSLEYQICKKILLVIDERKTSINEEANRLLTELDTIPSKGSNNMKIEKMPKKLGRKDIHTSIESTCSCSCFKDFSKKINKFDDEVLNYEIDGDIVIHCPKCKEFINPKITLKKVPKTFTTTLLSPKYLFKETQQILEDFKSSLTGGDPFTPDISYIRKILINIVYFICNETQIFDGLHEYFVDFLFKEF